MKYFVRWEVQIDADSAEEAARAAAANFFYSRDYSADETYPIVEVSETEIAVRNGDVQVDTQALACRECGELYCDCECDDEAGAP